MFFCSRGRGFGDDFEEALLRSAVVDRAGIFWRGFFVGDFKVGVAARERLAGFRAWRSLDALGRGELSAGGANLHFHDARRLFDFLRAIGAESRGHDFRPDGKRHIFREGAAINRLRFIEADPDAAGDFA